MTCIYESQASVCSLRARSSWRAPFCLWKPFIFFLSSCLQWVILRTRQSLYIHIFFIAFFSLPPSPSLFMDPASRDNSLEILLTNPPKTDAHTIFCVPGCLEDQQEIPRRTNKLQPQAAPCSYPEGPERVAWHGVLQPQVAPCHSQDDQRLELSMVFSYTSSTYSLFIFLRPLWQCRIGHHDGFNPQLSASHRTPCSVFHLHLCILHRVLIFWYWIWTEKRPAPPQPSHFSPDQTTSEAEILVSTRVCFLVIWLQIIFGGCSLLLQATPPISSLNSVYLTPKGIWAETRSSDLSTEGRPVRSRSIQLLFTVCSGPNESSS